MNRVSPVRSIRREGFNRVNLSQSSFDVARYDDVENIELVRHHDPLLLASGEYAQLFCSISMGARLL